MNKQSNLSRSEILNYQNHYSARSFWSKITASAKKLGIDNAKKAVELFYLLSRKDVPLKTKTLICGSLGYVILAIDAIPDLIPILGYTDDALVIGLAFREASQYLDYHTKSKASSTIKRVTRSI